MNKIFNNFIIIYPFLLIVNPKIIINFFNIFLIIAIIYKIKENGMKRSFFDKWCLTFILSVGISLIDIKTGTIQNIGEIKNILKWIFFPFLLGQFEIEEKTKKYINYSLMTGILYKGMILVLNLKEKFNIPDIKSTLNVIAKRREVLGIHLSQYSFFLGVTIVTALIIVLYKKNCSFFERFINALYIIVGIPILLGLQTRGMYLSTILALIIIVFLKNKKSIFMFIFVGIFSFILVQTHLSENKIVQRIKTMKNLKKDTASLARIEIFKESLRLFKTSPIAGIGYGNFREKQNKENLKIHKSYYHQHNMILKIVSETGIVGFISYCLMLGSLFWVSIRKYREDLSSLLMLGFLLVLFIYENTEVLIWKSGVYPFIYFQIGLLINNYYKVEKNRYQIYFLKLKILYK